MRQPLKRPALMVFCQTLLCLGATLLSGPPQSIAALLALRPGPIERPRHVVAVDLDRDGLDDLVVANFAAGTLDLLINQGDGTFALHPTSPVIVGFATFSQPTSGPFQIIVTDLNPEDVDSDRVANAEDNCPNVANPEQFDDPGVCGEGICDLIVTDLCTVGMVGAACTKDDDCDTPGLCTVGAVGNPCSEASDCDVRNGVGDDCQVGIDTNNDGTIDATIDTDQDGVPDYDLVNTLDNCPRLSNPGQEDVEPAGVCDLLGVCDGGSGLCTAGVVGDPCTQDSDCSICSAGRVGAGGCTQDSDCDGDGVGDACALSPDLVILGNSLGGGSTLGIVRVRVNDGEGGFFSRFSKATGVAPAHALLEDFDGDGRPDLVFTSRAEDEISVLPGEADGEFGAPRTIATGERPQGLAAGDFDDDGDLDLAVANSCDHTLGFYINEGTGIPDEVTDTVPTSSQPTILMSGVLGLPGVSDDFADLIVLQREDRLCVDGPRDGLCCVDDRDCADPDDPLKNGTCPQTASGQDKIEVYPGNASGVPLFTDAFFLTIPATVESLSAGLLEDLDGNGTLDLAVADFGRTDQPAPAIQEGQVLVYAGAADGSFTGPPIPTPAALRDLPQPIALATIDLDGPGAGSQDLAVLEFGANRVDLFRNDGSANFSLDPDSPASPWKDTGALALFGADALVGIDAVLLQRQSSRIVVLSGIPDSLFAALPVVQLEAAAVATGMVITDLKDDSRPDLIIFGLGRVCTGGPQDGGRCVADADCADPANPANNGTCGLDPGAGSVTVVSNEVSDFLVERDTVPIAGAVSAVVAGSLITSVDDFDHDGVADVFDNCPLRNNPPMCAVTDPACRMENLCLNLTANPTDCAVRDPLTDQCDSDGNGIGDHCQTLSTACTVLDTDFDLKFDYDPNALVTDDFDRDGVANSADNCPTTANNDQADDLPSNGVGDACKAGNDINANGIIESGSFCSVTTSMACDPDLCPTNETCEPETIDTDLDTILDYDPGPPATLDNCPMVANPGQEDNDNDGVGNICVKSAALDNCPLRFNPGQEDVDGDGVGDICEVVPVKDLVAVAPEGGIAGAGFVTLLTGDGTGALHEPPFSPVSGLTSPSAAAVGSFTLECEFIFTPRCLRRTFNDLVVAETLAATDHRLTVYLNGDAGFEGVCEATNVCSAPLPEALGKGCTTDRDCARLAPLILTEGTPSALLTAADQPVCSEASAPSVSGPRFSLDNRSVLLAAVQPDTSTLGVFLASNQNVIDPLTSPLVPPPGAPAALPVPPPLVDAVLTDMNRDGIMDLVAASGMVSNPLMPTPNVTIYIGMGNGLFFTDPTLNPDDVPDGTTHIAAGNINLRDDVFLPEVMLFNADGALIVLTNILNERADINGSGRVDGFDLAVLARAFGAARGEDFSLVLDPTGTMLILNQSSLTDPPYRRVLVPGAGPVPGQNLPDTSGFCNNIADSMEDPDGVCDLAGDCDVGGTNLCTAGAAIGTACTQDSDCHSCTAGLTGTIGCALDSDCNTGVVRYSLAIDINLDGIIDGEDLAFLASRFGGPP